MQNIATGLFRNTIDKFYTHPLVVKNCMQLVKKHINISKADLCIEPSAGDGKFIDPIKKMFNNHLFYDIKPEHRDIKKANFLAIDTNIFSSKYNKIHVIGNPPFGKKSSLAIQFIKKSCSFADTVSFILPKSFKKKSMQRSFPPNFHLVHEYTLPPNSFIINNESYNVPAVFQIWVNKGYKRVIPPKLLPIGYSFVKYNQNPDISIRRVGYNAGYVDTDINKSPTSHYFIKLNKNEKELIDKLNNVKFAYVNDTVGPKSISLQEITKAYNKILMVY